ncbi:hypothetical protein CQA81_31655, partial [Klebsiella pneumoniae]
KILPKRLSAPGGRALAFLEREGAVKYSPASALAIIGEGQYRVRSCRSVCQRRAGGRWPFSSVRGQ